jgi:flagellar hook-basal body complex protein FliE
MTAPIAAIGAISGLGSAGSVAPAAATNTDSATNFAKALGNGIDQVQSAQTNADSLAVQAATGQLTDPATYTIAATQAQLMTQLMTTLESKGVEAFNQIMSMQA